MCLRKVGTNLEQIGIKVITMISQYWNWKSHLLILLHRYSIPYKTKYNSAIFINFLYLWNIIVDLGSISYNEFNFVLVTCKYLNTRYRISYLYRITSFKWKLIHFMLEGKILFNIYVCIFGFHAELWNFIADILHSLIFKRDKKSFVEIMQAFLMIKKWNNSKYWLSIDSHMHLTR